MALSVKHAFQTLEPDDPAKDVSANEWNEDHTLTGVLGVANGGTGTTTGAVLISDTPPAGAPDNSLWWESDSGLLYLRFNDGTSTQWVLAAPQPDVSVLATTTYVDAADTALTTLKVAKAGDTMTGALTLNPPGGGGALVISGAGTASIEIGRIDGTDSTPLIDFHSGAVATDFDARLYSTGGNGSNGGGALNILGTGLGLPIDPTLPLHAATKQYVDGRVSKSGDTMTGDLTPAVNGAVNLGSATLRWGTVFTSDLDLNNGVGDWTIVEGADDLFLYNNKKGKTYKFALVEVDTAPPKKV